GRAPQGALRRRVARAHASAAAAETRAAMFMARLRSRGTVPALELLREGVDERRAPSPAAGPAGGTARVDVLDAVHLHGALTDARAEQGIDASDDVGIRPVLEHAVVDNERHPFTGEESTG